MLERAGCTPDDVGLWLWTQVNRSTIEMVMRTLGQPMERAHTVMGKWGYTGSACLPMALDDAVRAGRLHDGELVLFTGSGAGLAMGALAMRWAAAPPGRGSRAEGRTANSGGEGLGLGGTATPEMRPSRPNPPPQSPSSAEGDAHA